MVDVKDKIIFKNLKNQDTYNLPKENVKADVVVLGKEKQEKKVRDQKQKKIFSHTETDINWAEILNKITVSNVIKGIGTLGGGSVGALLGAGIGSGIGFAFLGPSGAVLGLSVGNLVGFSGGTVAGYKLVKFTTEKIEIEDGEKKVLVEKGITEVKIDTLSEKNIER